MSWSATQCSTPGAWWKRYHPLYAGKDKYGDVEPHYFDEGLNSSIQTEQERIRLKAFKICQNSENYQKTLEAVQRMNMDDKKEVKIQYGNKKSTGIHTGTVFSPPAPPGLNVLFRVKEK